MKRQWSRMLIQHFVPNVGTLVLVALMLFGYHVWAAEYVSSPASAPSSFTLLPYQGTLTTAQGTPLNGTVEMTFRIYNVPTGGTPLWSEAHTGSNAVPVHDGLFHLFLGSLVPFPSTLWDADTLYLGIQIGDDAEMTPREVIGAVPLAHMAFTVPDGSISTQKIADESITTVHFASSDVKFVLSGDDQWHDDPDLHITANFAGGGVLIEMSSPGTWSDTERKAIDARLLIDGVQVATARNAYVFSASGWNESQTSITWFQELSPGTHTIQVQWRAMAGINRAWIGSRSTRTLTVLELKR